jgi:transcriptional antiterminator NusG
MAASWYVLQVFSGYENRVEKVLRLMLDRNELDKAILHDIKIPTEVVTEQRNGKKRSTTRKFFPGYILLELDLPELAWKATCSGIKKIQGVNGFVGVLGDRKPTPLSGDEARAILQRSGSIKGEKAVRVRQDFQTGEQVKITEGPFESFTGVIEEVNSEKSKLKVMVGIFGRNTPVEVDLSQVEKV